MTHKVTVKIRSKLAGLNFGLLSLSTNNARTPSKKFLSLKLAIIKYLDEKCLLTSVEISLLEIQVLELLSRIFHWSF